MARFVGDLANRDCDIYVSTDAAADFDNYKPGIYAIVKKNHKTFQKYDFLHIAALIFHVRYYIL